MNRILYFEQIPLIVAGGMKKRLAGWFCPPYWRMAASFFLVRSTADCYFCSSREKVRRKVFQYEIELQQYQLISFRSGRQHRNLHF